MLLTRWVAQGASGVAAGLSVALSPLSRPTAYWPRAGCPFGARLLLPELTTQRSWLPVPPSSTSKSPMGRRAEPLVQVAATGERSTACAAKVATMRVEPGAPTSSVQGEGRDRYRLCCQRAETVLNFPSRLIAIPQSFSFRTYHSSVETWRHRPSLCLFTPTIKDGCRTCQTVKGALRARMQRRRTVASVLG